MRRVVVTGMGIVSSIGNNTQEVLASLREAKSGISRAEPFAQNGFRCQVYGAPTLDPSGTVDRRAMRFLGPGSAWNHVAMEQAIRDSGVEQSDISNERTGIVMGSGGPSTSTIVAAADITRKNTSPKRIGPFAVPKAMSSTASATLATWFKIKGVNYSISSACATSNHCIGNAAELIQWGKQDMVFAGGSEELDWTLSNMFDAMGAMSSKFNQMPQKASRAYDVDRDGFVIAGGAGVLVLEELEHAKARGAKIYAEVAGYGVDRERADRLHQSACDLDADRRSQGDRGDPRGVRRQVPDDLGDQVADRSFARRRRRARGDLFAADDEQRLRLRKREHREPRSGLRRYADRARAQGQSGFGMRAVELVRVRRHQRVRRVQAVGRVRVSHRERGLSGEGRRSVTGTMRSGSMRRVWWCTCRG